MPLSSPFIELRPRPKRRWWLRSLVTLIILVGLLGGGVAATLWYVSNDLPALDSVQEYQPSLVSRVYSDDHQVIGQYYVERRILTPISEIPQILVQAVIAVEDVRFFEHPGLDVIGIVRAFWANLRHGGKVEGASTITQQLARSLFLSPVRTYSRKVKELILAYKMELVLTKEQILEMYLNQIYFGQGAYGVGAAAQTYFGKELSELTLPEAAFLAGIPKSPNNYSPFKNPERAKKRQEHVLSRMKEAGFITTDEYQEAVTQQLPFRYATTEQIAPHFIEYIRQHLMASYGEAAVYKGGLEVAATLNVDMQKAAEEAVRNGLRALDKRQGWRGPIGTQSVELLLDKPASSPAKSLRQGDLLQGVVTKVGKDHVVVQAGGTQGRLAFDDMGWARRRLKGRDPNKDVTVPPSVKQLLKPGDVIEVGVKKVDRAGVEFHLEQTPIVEGALVAIDPRSGAIRAMVGGYDFGRSEYNRAVIAHRQPGSAFKPLIYATALNKGMSPATIVVDAPVVYEQDDPEKTWKPDNYEHKFYGAISLREALIHSRNAATVRLLEKIGVRDVIDFAQTVGVTSPLSHDLSLALGSSSLTLLELTSVYGVFANQGIRVEPYAIATVQDHGGAILEQSVAEPRQAVSKETVYLLTNVLEDVIQKGTGQLAKSIDRPVAGKTGTTNDYTDAWFVGYTPNLVVGVWVGFDDVRTLGEKESGAHAALPIWTEFMHKALEPLPVMPFEIPDEIQFVRVDSATGLLLPDQGGQGTVEIFAKGTEPTQVAPQRADPTDFYKLDQVQDGTAIGTAVQP